MMVLEKAVITVTARPITMAGLSCDVTASAEQIPNTCPRIGLSTFNGFVKTSLFCLLNNAIVLLLLCIWFNILQAVLQHGINAIRSEGCTSYTVNLSSGVLNLLNY